MYLSDTLQAITGIKAAEPRRSQSTGELSTKMVFYFLDREFSIK